MTKCSFHSHMNFNFTDLDPKCLFWPLAVDVHHEEQILNCNMPDTEDGVAYENQDEEAVAMIEESPPGVGMNLSQHGTCFPFCFNFEFFFPTLNIPCESTVSLLLLARTLQKSIPFPPCFRESLKFLLF